MMKTEMYPYSRSDQSLLNSYWNIGLKSVMQREFNHQSHYIANGKLELIIIKWS